MDEVVRKILLTFDFKDYPKNGDTASLVQDFLYSIIELKDSGIDEDVLIHLLNFTLQTLQTLPEK